ncbi:MAG: hypothetical protein ACI3VZ_08185 [Faecousia sp.]
MVITHKLRPMDLTERSVSQRVDTVQDDKYSRNLEIPLIANGAPWVIPDGTTAVIRFRKSDGTGGNYDTMPDGSTAYIISGNKLTVALAPQVCTAPGAVLLAVGLVYGDAEINTFAINITVHPNPGINVVSGDYTNMRSYVKSTGWEPNVYLGTDDAGNIIPVIGGGAPSYSLDETLTSKVKAAQAKAVGDAIAEIGKAVESLGNDIIDMDGRKQEKNADVVIPKQKRVFFGGENGSYVTDETSADFTPVLAFYGQLGDEPVTLRGIQTPEQSGDATNKQYVDAAVRKAAPYNYAHNSDFTQFVAQAGVGGLHGTQAYAGDRWILDSGTVTGIANADGNGYKNIILNGTIRQKVENPPATGKAKVEMVSGTATVSYTNGELTITSSGGVIKDVLLCAAETLPEYQPKGYGAELAECQRYYNVIQPDEYLYRNSYADLTVYSILIQFPKMRIVPTVEEIDGTIEGRNGATDSSLRLFSTQQNSIINKITLSADL